MKTQTLPRSRIALSAYLLTDATRASYLAGIQKVSPQSTLMQDPAIAASVAALVKKGTTLANNINAASAAEAVLSTANKQRDTARGAYDMELITLKGLVENGAKSPQDVTDMGFVLLQAQKASRTPPDPPATLLVKIGKQHGKARVSVPGGIGSFVAEVASDPTGAGPWTSLPGTGTERKLSGYPTGTRLWVHFAAVRYGMQSAWSTPVLVIIP